MKKRLLTGIIASAALILSGCGDQEAAVSVSDSSSAEVSVSDDTDTTDATDATDADTTDTTDTDTTDITDADTTDTTDAAGTSNDSAPEYEDQKIVFMMWIASYDEPYSKGYFIDGKGMKHTYERQGISPMYPVEDEYAYLIEHYDEFDSADCFDSETLKQCMECLYKADADAEIITEGDAIADAPEKSLYGVRMNGDQPEFVFLGSEPGISKRLNDASADKIFELFGDKWYLQ